MRGLTIHIPDSKDMSTESETGINMPTSSAVEKATLSSREGSATYPMHRRSFLGGTGHSWDLAKAMMAMALVSLTGSTLVDHYTQLSAELDMWHREAAKRGSCGCVTCRNFCYFSNFSVLLLGIWDLGDLGSSLT